MSAVNRVFAAQLAGLPVFGPDGESIGKVRDLVVGLRLDHLPPRVLGLVIELGTRRRVFVPMLRVSSIEPNAVSLATGSVNMRHFHQRPNEILVIGQLSDAHARLATKDGSAEGLSGSDSPGETTGQTRVTIVDAAMEQTRSRDWVLTKVAVRERGNRLLGRRRSSLQVLQWNEITAL